MSPTWLAVAQSILLGLLVFMGFWLVVTGLLASFSGWPRLAAAFPAGNRPPGTALSGQILGVGAVRENNVTVAIPAESGLYLYSMSLFRFGRPPVLVPWTQVRYRKPRQFLWSRWHELDLGGITSLQVRPHLLSLMKSHGVALPGEALV